jgi:hypothetical protein
VNFHTRQLIADRPPCLNWEFLKHMIVAQRTLDNFVYWVDMQNAGEPKTFSRTHLQRKHAA